MGDIFRQFKIPIIIVSVLLVVFIGLGVVLPAIQESQANKTPIVSIEAKNDIKYSTSEEIVAGDFTVTAIHEDGAKTKVNTEDIDLSKTKVNPIGATTNISVTYVPDPSITCDVEIQVAREKVLGFSCGYPNSINVIAVLYTNGELCFEGEGDILTFDESDYPWKKYDQSDDYPITSISFEDGVTPTNLDGAFSGIKTLTFVDAIPTSAISMQRTFARCDALETMADWSKCENLLNISESYMECINLKYTTEVPTGVTKSTSAFEECVSLQKTPNLSKATSLRQADAMFAECTKLVSITMPPNVSNIESAFMNCINLKIMPTIPESVKNMNSTFKGNKTLTTLATIPSGVESMESTFANCDQLTGEVEINANPQKMSNAFDRACVATTLNLTGQSVILDAFANSNKEQSITVNGAPPTTEMRSYSDYERAVEEAEKLKALEAKEAAEKAALEAQVKAQQKK